MCLTKLAYQKQRTLSFLSCIIREPQDCITKDYTNERRFGKQRKMLSLHNRLNVGHPDESKQSIAKARKNPLHFLDEMEEPNLFLNLGQGDGSVGEADPRIRGREAMRTKRGGSNDSGVIGGGKEDDDGDSWIIYSSNI